MTDPKTAARTIADRLAVRDIRLKHVQTLDLVAAGCGFHDRSKLKGLAALPVLRTVHAKLLASTAMALARHDADRRAAIIEVTTGVLTDNHGRQAKDDDRAWVIAMTLDLSDDAIVDEPWTVFWNQEDGWVAIDQASVLPDRAGRLPMLAGKGMETMTIRWMEVEDAAFRAAVDAAVARLDREDPPIELDPDVPGERDLDYDAIARLVAGSGALTRNPGPLEIAVRDGAQRATLYTISLSDDPETAGGQLREWVEDVEKAFDAGAPDEATLRSLLMDGDAAVAGIRTWLPVDDRLWAWVNVAAYPDAIDFAIEEDRTTPATTAERLAAATLALRTHDFGRHAVVGETDEWAWHPSGDVWSRTVYFTHDQADIDEDTDAAAFKVRFAQGTDQVVATSVVDDTSPPTLTEERTTTAQEAYEAHDFGTDVADQSGWEYATPGDEWTRPVYFKRYDDAHDEIGDTEMVRYVVTFQTGTAKVAHAGVAGEAGVRMPEPVTMPAYKADGLTAVTLGDGQGEGFWDVVFDDLQTSHAEVSTGMTSITIHIEEATGELSLSAGYMDRSPENRDERSLFDNFRDAITEALAHDHRIVNPNVTATRNAAFMAEALRTAETRHASLRDLALDIARHELDMEDEEGDDGDDDRD